MIRFALVNAGSQAAAVARVAPRWRGGEIAAVVEPAAENGRRIAQQFGVVAWATSPQELHEKHDGAFDAWLSATPLGWLIVPHANQPLRLSPDQWQDHPAGWQWGHSHRFLPSVLAVKESVDARKLGDPGLVRIHAWRAQPQVDLRHSLLPQLELAAWLIGQPVTVVFAQAHASPVGAGGAPDSLQVHLGFAGDRMALVDVAALPTGGHEYYSLSVIGSTGAAYADDHHNLQLLLAGDRPHALRTSQGDRALLAMAQEYLDAAGQSREPRCGAAEWKLARRLATAVERSLRTRQSVTFAGDVAP